MCEQYTLTHPPIHTSIFGSVHLAVVNSSGDNVIAKVSSKTKMASMMCIESPVTEREMYERLSQARAYQSGQNREKGCENVVRALDFPSTPTHSWAVLEYCEKGDMCDMLFRSKLSLEETRTFFRQIVQGVSYLHRLGICHRDLSPENIFVNKDYVCKIGDLGQAVFLDPESPYIVEPSGKKAGKPFYRAPEVWGGQPYHGFAADVFSLGVCLFIMLTGVPPFQAALESDRAFQMIQKGLLSRVVEKRKLLPLHPLALDLLNGMMCPVRRRFTIDEVLSHPLLSSDTACFLPPDASEVKGTEINGRALEIDSKESSSPPLPPVTLQATMNELVLPC